MSEHLTDPPARTCPAHAKNVRAVHASIVCLLLGLTPRRGDPWEVVAWAPVNWWLLPTYSAGRVCPGCDHVVTCGHHHRSEGPAERCVARLTRFDTRRSAP